MVDQSRALNPSSRIRARKRAARQQSSFLLKHYTLFNSLTRYTLPSPPGSPSSKRTFSSAVQPSRAKAERLSRLQQRYPIGGIWSCSWPKPFPQLPATAQEPTRVVEELVEQIVKDTFDAEYAKFRSPKWASEHRITKEHREKIVVDGREVKESAEAAKALVNTALNRLINGAKKGAIGKSAPSSTATRQVSAPASTSATAAPERANGEAPTTATADSGTTEEMETDEHLDAGLERVLWEDEEQYSLDWRGLLDYFQSTAGSSKTAQWRNWHLLNAIKQTRKRCEELFGHEDR